MATQTITTNTLNFRNYKKGDSFKSEQLQLYQRGTTTPPSNTLSSVAMKFRKGGVKGVVQKSISNGSGIVIDDATNWIITISAFTIDWSPDIYYYDIETTDSSSLVDTILSGTIQVQQDVTNNE